jgi:hypothetical protein
MQLDTDSRAAREAEAARTDRQRVAAEQSPTWEKTTPPGNPETDQGDLERSRERFEALLGR